MFLLSALLILLSLLQEPPTPSVPATASTVTEAEERFTAALLNKDDVALADLLADDLLHIGFDGQFAGKAEYMAFFKHGAWQYLKYEPTNVAVKVLGNVTVVTGRVNRTIIVNNKQTTGALAFTHVWSQAGSRWRLTSSQLTSLPNPSS